MPDNPILTAFQQKPAEAIAYLKNKGYAISWNWHDQWQDAHAKAFTVAKVMRADILQDIREMVDKAVSEGISFQQFKKELKPRLQKKGWWGRKEIEGPDGIKEVQLGSTRRLQTIFDTNTQSAYMAGRYKGLKEVAEDRPYWQYIAVLDASTRPEHRALHGKVLRHDDPFWDTHYPPNGYKCRCRTRSLSDKDISRRGLSVEDSSGNIVTKEVPIGSGDKRRLVTVHGYKTQTGDGQPTTVWTDPGWDYNPGKAAWEPDTRKYDKKIAVQIPKKATTRKKASAKKQPASSAFEPEGFAKKIGSVFPVKFWDAIGKAVPFKLSRGMQSYYKYPRIGDAPGQVTLGTKRHKTPESKKFVAAHEYGHVFHRFAIEQRTELKTKFEGVMSTALEEFNAFDQEKKKRFNNPWLLLDDMGSNAQDPNRSMMVEWVTSAADTVAALTTKKYGFGHSAHYFASGKGPTEFAAHTASTHFAGNPAMKKLLPKTSAAMKEFWEEAENGDYLK